MTVLGLILARGGSKRIPGKNIRDLGGMPLIAWSIASAIHAHRVDAVVVSSDSDDILKVAAQHGAATIKRPAALCTDDASSYPSILHAIDKLDGSFDWVCLLQPTSPFRQPADIDNCWTVMGFGRQGTPASVACETGKIVPNGAVYWAHTGWLVEQLATGVLFPWDGPVPAHYWMPPERSHDLDTEADWDAAVAMLMRTEGTA